MARRRSAWDQVQRDLYFTQRTMGDVSAARRGPSVLVKRVVRRDLTREFFKVLRQVMK